MPSPFLKFKFKLQSYRPEVIFRGIERVEQTRIMRGVGFIRTVMRRSMAYRKDKWNMSAPGMPPHSHVKGTSFSLRGSIQPAFDRSTRSGVVGATNQFKDLGHLHEFGGIGEIVRTKDKKKIRKRVRFPARPFANPAMEKAIETGKIEKLWANVIQ